MTAIEIAGAQFDRGEYGSVEIPVSRLPTETWLTLPVQVVHGVSAGPTMWLSAAVHGDELNGIEIIRRVLDVIDAATLTGTILAVPVVNVFGLIQQSRYLPDRRDLNRCFPGSAKGSTASRLARLFMDEIVGRCQYGIDLHTGSNHRTNLPQIRANLDKPATAECASAFRAPVHAQFAEPRWVAQAGSGCSRYSHIGLRSRSAASVR